MVWLYFIILVLLFTYFGEKRRGGKWYKVSRILLLLTLSLMTGLGSIAGADHESYLEIYSNYTEWYHLSSVTSILQSYILEPGFIALSVIGNKIMMPEPVFFVFLTLLMNTPIVFLIYKFHNPLIAILVFVLTINYLQEINLMRQCLAISYYSISVYFLNKRNMLLHIVFVALAFLFHTSVIVCLPLSLIGIVNLNKNYYKITGIAWVLWFFSIIVHLGVVHVHLFDSLSAIFGDTRFHNYASGDDDAGYGTGFNYMFNVIFILVMLTLKKNIDVFKIFIILGVCFINFDIPFLSRYALYFLIFVPITCGEYLRSEAYPNSSVLARNVVPLRFIFITYWFYTLLFGNILGNPLLGSKFYVL